LGDDRFKAKSKRELLRGRDCMVFERDLRAGGLIGFEHTVRKNREKKRFIGKFAQKTIGARCRRLSEAVGPNVVRHG